ncbi:Glutamyl aminopeptidase [Trachymyrmex zeteki]|uniref:Glutamyl aminopeptidase n=1 Tax=Mycetomoellerius zeteki TaxID=64791 RepID=A0A151WXG9_9HYME|nr:Glutamyl aminopeptidase [Trachymyrmex zeteki]
MLKYGRWLIASNSHARRARKIFPCWDELTFIATYKISILHHKKYTVLSNMKISSAIDRANDMVLTKFIETPLMPAYHVSILISDLSRANMEYITMRSYLTYDQIYNLGGSQIAEGVKFAEMILMNVILRLEPQYKYCERIAKVHYVVLPIFYPDIQNSPGLIFYRGTSIIYDALLDSSAHKIDVALLIGRESVLQCFKRLGGPAWWPHSWLYEGIARLFAEDVVSKTFKSSHEVLQLLIVQGQQESLYLNSIMKPLSELNAMYSHSSISHYIKAPNILRMLRYILTDEAFLNGTDLFLRSLPLFRINEGDNIYIEDLWMKMEQVLTKSDNILKFNVGRIMHFWTRLDDYPIIRMVQYNSSYVKIFVENIDALGTVSLPIITQTHLSKNMEWSFSNMQIIPFNRRINEFFFLLNDTDCDFIIIDIAQSGYYRVIYEGTCWNCIVKYLQKSWNDTNFINKFITPSNCARIIDDAFYFVMNYKHHLSAFLDLLKYILRDVNYVIWYPAIKGLEHISSFFLFEESSVVKTHMRGNLRWLLNSIGYIETSDEPDSVKCLRQEAAKWACLMGDSRCKDNATFLLKQHLTDDKKYKILPWWKTWTYCNGLMQNLDIWSDTFRAWMFHSRDHFITYLPCTECPITAFIKLKEIMDNVEGVLKHELSYNYSSVTTDVKDRINRCFLSIVARHARNRTVFEYIIENFYSVKPRELSSYKMIIVMMNHVYSSEQLFKVK